jgi:hypothetical protein
VNGDSALRAEVESLLRADERNGEGFLDEPALGVGFNVMSAGSEAAATPSPGGDESRKPGRIGAYHTLEVLAESDDVVVWLAEQREPVERRVAIKVLRSGAARRGVQKRFELERRAVALMEHPNIARLYDAGTHAGWAGVLRDGARRGAAAHGGVRGAEGAGATASCLSRRAWAWSTHTSAASFTATSSRRT